MAGLPTPESVPHRRNGRSGRIKRFATIQQGMTSLTCGAWTKNDRGNDIACSAVESACWLGGEKREGSSGMKTTLTGGRLRRLRPASQAHSAEGWFTR